ncbi:TetR/AcrR family transcriptional regulator [Gordonia neofelifaecis]|uniref:Transcriptional regulator TetR n=1 Tax=Gordonia neofelifaecis NRRL B-59395 TaxID=644548 RepID=F1YMD9_9ACTN|nr:TetR/AcrR family transcriptional regulator [Gordonia neofelifaecis]EGD54188.1 transcriptional regulator TetR [Gordonia neofelifaecis NRRL B-59395]
MVTVTEQAIKPTRRGRATQDAIDAAARKVIAEKGFLKMTVADIVKEAGKSPASFYNYYDSKEALMESWARQFQLEARTRAAAYERSGTTRARVEAAARAHWETYRDHLAEMVGVYQLAMINDDFAQVWDEVSREAVDGISQGIVLAQKKGYCPGHDAELVARAIVAMMQQFCYDNLAAGRAETADDEACIATLTEIWYRSVFWTE